MFGLCSLLALLVGVALCYINMHVANTEQVSLSPFHFSSRISIFLSTHLFKQIPLTRKHNKLLNCFDLSTYLVLGIC